MPTTRRVPDASAAETGVSADAEWLDIMVKKLFTELERQLEQAASSKASDAAARAANARTLSALERTLERLVRLERERIAVRERKVTRLNDNARQTLERRLDQLLAGGGARQNSRGAKK